MNPVLAALVGVILGAILGAGLVWWLALRPAQAALARQQDESRAFDELRRRLQSLRHDLRGALSPAMLSADRLTMHQDEKVQRAANVVMASLDRSTALLVDPAREVRQADDQAPRPE